MIIYGYGCSWTEGEGCDISVENEITDRTLKKEFRNSNSWLKFLSDKLNLESVNKSFSGNANNKIFNDIVLDIKNGVVKKGDFVIVMWSSSLRDYVPFLPKGEWVSWSVKHLIETPEKFIESYKSEDIKYDEFLKKYKDTFVLSMFNQNYYNIVNQNYIIFLQSMFKEYGINYLMCDSFESTIIDLQPSDDVMFLIDDKPYWRFNKTTFRDFLNNTNRLDIWEHQDANFKTRATQHPNKEGYKLISEELYNYIVDNNLI
jgi:hypothetical protein